MSEQSLEQPNETQSKDAVDTTQPPILGTLLRGTDGHLYFIPAQVLQPFRVADHVQAALEEQFAGQGATSTPRAWASGSAAYYCTMGPPPHHPPEAASSSDGDTSAADAAP